MLQRPTRRRQLDREIDGGLDVLRPQEDDGDGSLAAPYAFAGDVNESDYLPWTPAVGTHTVTTAGTAKSPSFELTDKRKGKP